MIFYRLWFSCPLSPLNKNMVSITQHQIEGFEAFQVDTGSLTLTVIPALGGKISSLRDTRNGREWLWHNPRLPYRTFPHGSGYVEADTGGWDECFPTVDACQYPTQPWSGAAIQDHGELWSQQPSFEVEDEGDMIVLRTRWQGIALPYRFERTIGLAPKSARLRFDYAVHNTSDHQMPVIWAAHPLMAIEPGMRLLVPDGARFNATAVFPQGALRSRRGLSFPLQVGEMDLSVLPKACGVALKLWSDRLDDGWATLQANDGEFRLRWNAGEYTQLALWLNLGAGSGVPGEPYYNLGLEPCIGAQDAVDTAVENENLFLNLSPHGEWRWWLEVELHTDDSLATEDTET